MNSRPVERDFILALYRRPHVKAGGRYKDGEFFIEVSEPRADRRP
jgi:hypothetical protein